MHILIDYENVGTAGLKGAEYLCVDDIVILFFSMACSNIERMYMECIERQSGDFNIIKLKTVRKNGIDFYIAVRVGQIAEASPESNILIVTKDTGFKSIRDYCQSYTALKNRIIIRDSIEKGIVAIDGDSPRKKTIIQNRERLSIETEYSAFTKYKKIEKDVITVFRGTDYENMASQIIDILDSTTTPRDRYLSSLHTFGIIDGPKIYRIIKNAV